MLKSTCQQIFKKIQHFDFFKELAIADGLFTGRNLQVVWGIDSWLISSPFACCFSGYQCVSFEVQPLAVESTTWYSTPKWCNLIRCLCLRRFIFKSCAKRRCWRSRIASVCFDSSSQPLHSGRFVYRSAAALRPFILRQTPNLDITDDEFLVFPVAAGAAFQFSFRCRRMHWFVVHLSPEPALKPNIAPYVTANFDQSFHVNAVEWNI